MKISVRKIYKEIELLNKRLKNIQSKCPHLNKTEEYGSNTGNLSEVDDRYWTTFQCSDCDKRWTVYTK